MLTNNVKFFFKFIKKNDKKIKICLTNHYKETVKTQQKTNKKNFPYLNS